MLCRTGKDSVEQGSVDQYSKVHGRSVLSGKAQTSIGKGRAGQVFFGQGRKGLSVSGQATSVGVIMMGQC